MKWIFVLLLPTCCFASIEQICSIQEVEHRLEVDKDVLVIFDVDDTLTILSEPAFQYANYKVHHSEVFSKFMSSLNEEVKFIAFNLPILISPSELIEPQTPSVIESLQNKGLKTIALTAVPAGNIDGLLLEDARIADLRRVGINFASCFPHVSDILFTNFPAGPYQSYILFKEGIIFANYVNKGAVLVEFLKNINWEPDVVIFVDDRIDHVYAVEKHLAEFNPKIEYKGLHFQTQRTPYKKIEREDFSAIWQEIVDTGHQIASKNLPL